MKQNKTALTALTALTLALSGCGGSSSSSSNSTPTPQKQTLSGTAATGLAMAGGTVEVTNANGKKSSITTINADGTYSVEVEKGSPYLVKATTKASAGVEAKSEYGYATDAIASNVNVTQLTTLALFDAAGQIRPDSVYADWANKKAVVTDAKVIEAAKKVVANLSTALKAQGYTDAEISTLNVLNQKFTPATPTSPTGDRFDKVLDVVKPTYSCNTAQTACTGSYSVAGTTVNWNTNVSTAGVNINMGGSGPAGSGGACMVNITVMGVGNKVCLSNFPENAACSEANAAVKAQAAAYAQIGASVSYASAASCAGANTTINYQP